MSGIERDLVSGAMMQRMARHAPARGIILGAPLALALWMPIVLLAWWLA